MVPNLKYGSQGAAVRALQQGLNLQAKQDYMLGLIDAPVAPQIRVDGDFKSETEGAVARLPEAKQAVAGYRGRGREDAGDDLPAGRGDGDTPGLPAAAAPQA